MPRFNEHGEITEVYRPWFDQTRTVFQHCADGRCVILLSNGEVVREHAANVVLGSGHGGWVAWEKHPEGAFDFLGRTFPLGVPLAIGPDNAIALKLDHFSTGPFEVIQASGERWRLSDSDIYGVQLLGNKQAIWMGVDRHVRANFPAVLPTRLCWGARYCRGIFLVQDIETGSLVLDGHVLRPSGDYFFFDLFWTGTAWRVTYAPNEADVNPVLVDISPEELAALPLVRSSSSEPPIVVPKPEPKPEKPVYQRISPDYSAHILKCTELFPAEWDRANKEKHGSRTDEFIRLCASYLHTYVDKNVGNNGKRGGDELSQDALAYKNDSAPGGAEVIDVIIGAGHKPTWSDATIPPMPHPQGRPEVPDGVLGKFIQPAIMAEKPGTGTGTGTGETPAQTSPASSVDAAVRAIVLEITTPLKAEIAALKVQLAARQAQPTFPKRIALRNKFSGKLLCRDENQGGLIHANDRDAAGDWEDWGVEVLE